MIKGGIKCPYCGSLNVSETQSSLLDSCAESPINNLPGTSGPIVQKPIAKPVSHSHDGEGKKEHVCLDCGREF